MGLMILACIWGFAEATFFFIIPDVILTFIAISGFSVGLHASLLALAGALIGGVVMYNFSKKNFKQAYNFVHRIPAVGEKMLLDVENSLSDKGVVALITGPIRGIPYKAFAIFSPMIGVRFPIFLLASIPARFTRFFLTAMIAWFLANVLFDTLPTWVKYSVWAIVWIIVYIIYFSIHPWSGNKKNST